SNLCTTTTAELEGDAHSSQIIVDGHRVDDAGSWCKPYAHLRWLGERYGFTHPLRLHTHNNFPTGAGVASSASGLFALTAAALAAWTQSTSWEDLEAHGFSRTVLAHLARQGSGSAGRSAFGGFVRWEAGKHPEAQRIIPLFPPDHWR